jgi:hypothetical protein
LQGWINAAQPVVDVAELIGGAVVWRLCVTNLRARMAAEDATIANVERSLDERYKAGTWRSGRSSSWR